MQRQHHVGWLEGRSVKGGEFFDPLVAQRDLDEMSAGGWQLDHLAPLPGHYKLLAVFSRPTPENASGVLSWAHHRHDEARTKFQATPSDTAAGQYAAGRLDAFRELLTFLREGVG